MRIRCIHGYFKFEEDFSGEIARIMNMFGLELVSKDDGYFTFPFLEDAPRYSLAGKSYLGVVATKTFEGAPWDIMRENNLVYEFTLGAVVPIASVNDDLGIDLTETYYLSQGLIVPGSITKLGAKVTDYSGRYIWDSGLFRYSEVKTQ